MKSRNSLYFPSWYSLCTNEQHKLPHVTLGCVLIGLMFGRSERTTEPSTSPPWSVNTSTGYCNRCDVMHCNDDYAMTRSTRDKRDELRHQRVMRPQRNVGPRDHGWPLDSSLIKVNAFHSFPTEIPLCQEGVHPPIKREIFSTVLQTQVQSDRFAPPAPATIAQWHRKPEFNLCCSL